MSAGFAAGNAVLLLPLWACLHVAVAATASAEAPPAEPSMPAGFVDAATVVPGLAVDMRYHGSRNFIGRPVEGYDEPV